MNTSPFTTCKQIILASSSPRRIHFLKQFGLDFTSIAATIDETPLPGEMPDVFVHRMAVAKAESIGRQHPEAFIIGADTIICKRGKIIGKPENPDHALQTLQRLQGTSHHVITGLCLHLQISSLTIPIVKKTTIHFGSFSDTILRAYVRTGEPLDKAGAYALQGTGGFLVEKIDGSCSNAIGLPMNQLVRLLLEHGIIAPGKNH